ncbi:outer membrane beta-barrel protein [Caulobacter sp. 17J80-11]|uniref:outer membrane beta-barrel protein n=1 Tax=Caulobacter sp. 17J80-11 TaxID=2763502 RepID=UPI0016538615|nr:outer membrane beta-barrel protein [Caulobacter sp. 17J80-11]MBC6982487.1 outer membrane beta-barrel protein [Caulobacter sp. 17J80-11]
MKKIVLGVVAAAASLATTQAYAQQSSFERDRNVSVRERPHDDYESEGLQWGAFTAFPKLTVDAEVNDNIFATTDDEEQDLVWRVRPELAVQSGWSRHQLQAYARASVNRYAEFDGENTEDWGTGFSGRLDVVGHSYLYGGADYLQATESRNSSSTPGAAAEPVRYDLTSAQLGGVHEINRLRLSGVFGVRDYDYHDVARDGGGPDIDQDDRDRTVSSLGAKAEYAISPATAVFLTGSANKRDYRLATAGRDSDGYELAVGADFDVSDLARGQVAVGYLAQQYDAPGRKDVDGLGMRGQIEWFPTQLTTVTFKAERSVEDSGVAGSAGYLSTNGSAQVDWEVRRNLILTANAGWGRDEYKDIDRDDDRVTAGVSAAWLVNRNVGINLGYQYYDQASSGLDDGPDFKTNRVMTSLIFQL